MINNQISVGDLVKFERHSNPVRIVSVFDYSVHAQNVVNGRMMSVSVDSDTKFVVWS